MITKDYKKKNVIKEMRKDFTRSHNKRERKDLIFI